MAAQPPGRRTESLFDNRYRYDHIYPRGRSGETLRAYDTHDADRPVVIKRPAPQDAPPMRAGQEVSIRTEKQALERLSGHPVLTELRGSGTFRVGGQTHDYIVMDMAQGEIVENMVLERGSHLSELEILVIMDNLLSLLAHAHDKQVVYNDVDAKHLFWDRRAYHLKVIDWGNAVFLDEPNALPGVTRSTDIHQCGELLYFILTGGNRLATTIDEGDTFFVNFGPDAERIPARLQSILTRAVHPDSKRRYGTIAELRQALHEYRQPLEKARDDIVTLVSRRVRPTASQDELETLADELRAALDMDPGYPPAATLADQIQAFLKHIAVQADLDAIRIYLESNNWPRAHTLLNDLLPHADDQNAPLIRFLIAAAALLENRRISPAPTGFSNALNALFNEDAPTAGRILLTASEARPAAQQAQWLLAEQLAIQVDEVTLLRPHIVRLRHELGSAPQLDEIDAALASVPVPGLTGLRVIYEQVAAILADVKNGLSTSGDSSLVDAAALAEHAAHEVVTRLDDVGRHAFSDPSYASGVLNQAAMIDPTSPHFGALHDYFDEVHQALHALRQFRPNSTGSNLGTWFSGVQDFLQPYRDDIPDPQFDAAINAIRQAAEGWTTIVNYLALGRCQPTIKLLHRTADTIRPYNDTLAAWLGSMANRLPDAAYVERFSPNEPLADALIEGWKAWDLGNSIEAATKGQTAYDLATTDGERMATNRLRQIGELLDNWITNNGYTDSESTDRAETRTLSLLLAEEEQERRTFAEQMPNTSLYLRAMNRGIVSYMQQSSSAGWRALYLHYVLRGVLALLAGTLDEADFWREAAQNVFDNARTHRAFQTFDRSLTGRRLVQAAEHALNNVSGPGDLESVQHTLNAPLAGELLTGAEQSVQMLREALRHWSDGDFYETRQALDVSLENIRTAVRVASLDIEPFVNWVARLRDTAAELQQMRLSIEQNAAAMNPEPNPSMAEAHLQIVTRTVETIGSDHAHQVRQWQDMYQAILETYTGQRMTRREKLAAFDRHFASLFITKHPAYPLFRHWETVIEQQPPDELEDSVVEIDGISPPFGPVDAPAYLEDDRDSARESTPTKRPQYDLPWNWIIIGAIIVLLVAVGLAVVRGMGGDDDKGDAREVIPTDIIAPAAPGLATATRENVVTDPTDPVITEPPAPTVTTADTVETVAMAATSTPFPQPTVTSEAPTATPVPPTPTETVPPTITPTPTLAVTPTPVALAEGPFTAEGPNRSVLAALDAQNGVDLPWSSDALTPTGQGNWQFATGNAQTAEVALSPEMLSTLFQPGTSNTLISANAVFRLVGYDQTALESGEVSFGLGVENADGQRAMAQVQFVEANYVRLGLNQNDRFQLKTEAPQPNPQVELSIQRIDANTFSFLVDGRHLGDSVLVFAQGQPLTLILYASGAGVEVEISAFEIDYRPRSELP
ncbi:MAG: hypothetical protein JXQ72_04800 [Anaerolineae bacterium]|nr:hypothetical protein [Anaerolineae bacterium]